MHRLEDGKFVYKATTLNTCCALLHLANLQGLPIPKEVIVDRVFKDCLFVIKSDGKKMSWIEHCKVQEDRISNHNARDNILSNERLLLTIVKQLTEQGDKLSFYPFSRVLVRETETTCH
jgi:hypothetical protein